MHPQLVLYLAVVGIGLGSLLAGLGAAYLYGKDCP